MILLRFRVENHRSIRDEAELSLVRPSLTTVRPKDGDWVGATTRVAGIYGANASGKSTVVDALKFLRATVMGSATSWSLRERLPQEPFLLASDSEQSPSSYAIDFVFQENRYQYGFELDEDAVRQEWLYDYPSTKHRVLFEREAQEFKIGRALTGAPLRHASVTGERELFISKAKANGHKLLGAVWTELVDHLAIPDFSEQDQRRRLDRYVKEVFTGARDRQDLTVLLQVADIGIAGLDIDTEFIIDGLQPEPAMDDYATRLHRKRSAAEARMANAMSTDQPAHLDIMARVTPMQPVLRFQHKGRDGTFPLPLEVQSIGTLSWLNIALPALTTLRQGGVLIVDEIDASLHPQLSQVILRMFKDPDYNRTGAQLIFTTHDTFLMSAQSDAMLTPEETWFTEKGSDGATSLFSLADFPTRADQNFSKRYLDGRYGAVPRTARSFLATLLDAEPKKTTDA